MPSRVYQYICTGKPYMYNIAMIYTRHLPMFVYGNHAYVGSLLAYCRVVVGNATTLL